MRWFLMFLLKKSTGEEKFNMAATIGKLDKPKYRKPLLKLLLDSNIENSYAAAYALGLMGGEKAFDTLLQMVTNPETRIPNKHQEEVVGALFGSVDSKDPVMLAALFSGLKKDPARRYSAVMNLGPTAFGPTKGSPALLKQFAHLAVHDSYHEVRRYAYKYLKNNKMLDHFIEEIKNADLDTRIIAHEANQIELEKRDIEELAERLEFRDPRMRKHAADYLEKIEWEPRDKAGEARLLVGQQKWREALALGQASAIPLIEAVRSKIDYGLTGKQGSWSRDLTFRKNLSPKEKERLIHMEKSVRTSAAKALVKMGDKTAVEALVSALDDKDNHVISLAISSLGDIGDGAADAPIVDRLEKWNKTINNTAAIALGKIGGKEAVRALIKLLKHESHYVRSSAIKSLAKLKDEMAVTPLCDILLSDMPENEGKVIEDEANICEAAKALGEIGSKQSVKTLTKALCYEWYPAFQETVTALVDISGPEAKASLENTFVTQKPKKHRRDEQDYGKKAYFLLEEYYRGWGDEASDWIFQLYQNFPFYPLELTMRNKIREKIQKILIDIADVRTLDTLLVRINANSVTIPDLKITAGILEKNAKKTDTETLEACLNIPRREDVRYQIDRDHEEFYPYGLYTSKIVSFAREELDRRGSSS